MGSLQQESGLSVRGSQSHSCSNCIALLNLEGWNVRAHSDGTVSIETTRRSMDSVVHRGSKVFPATVVCMCVELLPIILRSQKSPGTPHLKQNLPYDSCATETLVEYTCTSSTLSMIVHGRTGIQSSCMRKRVQDSY